MYPSLPRTLPAPGPPANGGVTARAGAASLFHLLPRQLKHSRGPGCLLPRTSHHPEAKATRATAKPRPRGDDAVADCPGLCGPPPRPAGFHQTHLRFALSAHTVPPASHRVAVTEDEFWPKEEGRRETCHFRVGHSPSRCPPNPPSSLPTVPAASPNAGWLHSGR